MTDLDRFLGDVLKAAITELRSNPTPVHTFAFYHDHESGSLSICVDTKESSSRLVRQSNQWSMRYFKQHIANGNWDEAYLFQANVGRSLSLGDFARVNLARRTIPAEIIADRSFYIAMAKAVIALQQEILALAPIPEDVVFCCSSADAEVGLAWSALPIA